VDMCQEVGIKVCTRCKIEKPFSHFGKQKAGKHGLRSQCKTCCYDVIRATIESKYLLSPPPLPNDGVEEFKAVPDFAGYAVSDSGNIIGCRKPGPGHYFFESWSPIKCKVDKNGYYSLAIYGDGHKIRHTKAHVLVLEAFVEPRPDGMVVRHLDGNPQNNHLANICWGTVSENCIDRVRHGRNQALCAHGLDHPQGKFSDDVIAQVRILSETVSRKEIAKMFGMSKGYVGDIIRNKWRNYGKTNEPEPGRVL